MVSMKVVDIDYLLERIELSGDCWLWARSLQTHGYSYIELKAEDRVHKTQLGHRIAYFEFVGPIPKGLELDHSCNIKRCINPDHLEPVTHEENNRRRNLEVLKQRPNFRCGHPRTDEWGFMKRDGVYKSGKIKWKWACKPCYVEYNRKYREKKRAAANNLH